MDRKMYNFYFQSPTNLSKKIINYFNNILATSAIRAPKMAAARLCCTGLNAFSFSKACCPDMAARSQTTRRREREKGAEKYKLAIL